MPQLTELKDKLKGLVDVIKGYDVIYLDYAIHLNVGDLLIYHGTEKLFRDYKINVIKRLNLLEYFEGALDNLVNERTAIVFHGGGNFGDIYDVHQNFRRAIAQRYPNTRIVIFPQTLFYGDESNLAADVELFRGANDLHIFARDSSSVSLAEKLTDNVYLMPDIAHQLFGQLKADSGEPAKGELHLLRTDVETADQVQSDKAVDWKVLRSREDKMVFRLIRWLSKLSKKCQVSLLSGLISWIWFTYTKRIIKRTVNMFSRHERVVTSRLHGHILASLLGVHNDLIDNSYGKNSRYYGEWTFDLDTSNLQKV